MPRLLMVFKAPDGGAAENVVQLVQAVGEYGFEVELVGPLEATIYDRIPHSTPVHRLPLTPGYGPPGDDLATLRGLRSLLRSGDYDLVHAHSAQPTALVRLARLLFGSPPIVYTAHCFPFVGNISRRRLLTGLVVEWPLAPLTAAFIDVSEFERKAALGRGVGRPERHHLVRNACERCADVEPDPTLLGFRGDGPLMLVVTALRADKRIDVFLRALPEILRRYPSARAAVVGNGPESSAFIEVAQQLGLDRDGRLLMLPFEGPAARYLKCADIYVLPSSFESLPIGLLEAIACGVPQVATAVGGVGEAVTPQTGLTVPVGDPAAMTRALSELLGDPSRRERMAVASRARHAELFDLPRMVAETVAVYEEVLTAAA